MDLLYWAEGEKPMKHTLKELGFRVVGEGQNKHLEAPGYLSVDTPEDIEKAEEIDEVLDCIRQGKPLPTISCDHLSVQSSA